MKQLFFKQPVVRKYLLTTIMILTVMQPYAQNPENKLSLNLTNASLKELVNAIEHATQYTFVYSEEITLQHPINLHAEQISVRQIMEQVLKDEPVTYRFSGLHIFLTLKKTPLSPKRKFTISGYITDSASSETLIGAHITDLHRQQGTVSNPFGFYSITLPEGNTDLRFSYLGYASETCTFTLYRDTIVNIGLKSNTLLQEVVITSTQAEAGIHATQMGANEIPLTQIKNTPSLLGEADLMKTIQLMPGVQAGTDGSAGLYVRGGSPDQNLILLDGVPVYNIDHLFGFFSVFTPEAVKKVTLFKGSFPARFGGRLSSIIDVRTNDGDMQHYHGTFSIGLLSSKINVEGPIIKNKTSFNFSARRSYLDLISKPFMPEDEMYSYYFYDINAKINHKFSDRSRIFLTFYTGKDRLSTDYSDSGNLKDGTSMGWRNGIVAARWNYIFNNRLFSNTTVSFNHYQNQINTYTNDTKGFDQNIQNSYAANYRSGIKDWSYQIDFDYNPTPRHHIKFGTGYLFHRFQPEVITTRIHDRENGITERDTIYNSLANSDIRGHEITAYAEDNYQISRRLRMNLGLHLSLFHVQQKNYLSLQPRISARYQLMKNTALKASYTQMSQYIHLLSSSPITLPTDLWVPITQRIRPMYSRQYSLGGYYTGIPGWEFSIEGYYKDMHNVLEYKDGVSFFGSSTSWEEKVEMGTGRSFGMELMIQKTIGNTTGWLSYTLAKSDRKFANGSINNGERFPYKYDRRHNINLTVNHKFSEWIDIGASWVFYTGGTATIPEEKTAIILPEGETNSGSSYYNPSIPDTYPSIDESFYVEHRNNYRLPASHRLNLSVNFNKRTKHGVRTWNISLFNVYNAMNPAWIYRSYNSSTGKSVIKKYTLLPLIPSFTYTYKF